MTQLPISVCFWNYDRTLPMVDGRVTIDGCNPNFDIRRPEDAFERAFKSAEYDITELSLSRYMAKIAKGDFEYDCIPVFPSRAFRHGAIFIRTDRGIKSPKDLKGKKLGLLDFEMTAALAVRGVLGDDYGVAATDIDWIVGLVEDKDAENPVFQRNIAETSNDISISHAPKKISLNTLLIDGKIDGIIGLYEPSCIKAGAPVARLFPDWREVEQKYFKRTGIFPIMHTIGIRKNLLHEHPWLAQNVFNAFCLAKDVAIRELQVPQASKVTLLWVVAEYVNTVSVMGNDFWPYGFKPNQRVLEAMINWSFREGLITRKLLAKELFLTEFIENERKANA